MVTRHVETFVAALAAAGALGTVVWGVLALMDSRWATLSPLWFYGIAIVLAALWFATRERQ